MIAQLRAAIEADEPLMDLLHAESQKVYLSGTLGVGEHPADPPRPYVMLGELPGFNYEEVRTVSLARARILQFWAYDRIGTWETIDAILHRWRLIVQNFSYTTGPNGLICMEATNLSTSGGVVDAQYDGFVKSATARLVTNR